MSGEQFTGTLTMAALGVALSAVGLLARRGRLQLALGGWTRETATPASWSTAHRVIGTWFATAGGVALGSALAVAVSSPGWIGLWIGTGSLALLVLVVVGVTGGTNRLERAPKGDL